MKPIHALLNEFRDELLRQDRSLTTIKHYINDVDLFARWLEASYGETFDPSRTVQREVTEYRSYLGTVQSCSPATINRRLASLNKFYGWFVATGAAKTNPVAGVKSIAVVDPGVKAVDTVSLRRLLREVHVHDNKLHIVILEILCGTAARVQELTMITLDDVSLSDRKGSVRIRNGKGRASREVPLNVDVRKSIAAWLEVRPITESKYLIIGQRGDRMTPSGIWRIVKRYAALAGIPALRVHDLRHTVLTRLVRELGTDLATVAKISGHRNIKTLMRYCAPSFEDVSNAVDKLALAGD